MKNERVFHSSQIPSGEIFAGRWAFTLIELLVVIAVLATLAVVLLQPAVARAKASAAKSQCAANLRLLGSGVSLFADDHSGIFPPAGDQSIRNDQVSWDSYINPYISSGRLTQAQLETGSLTANQGPGILLCPADTGPATGWVAGSVGPNYLAKRTYAMNAAGPAYGIDWQVTVAAKGYKLPQATQGVGISWIEDPGNPWNAPGYNTSVVVQPSATILLVEEPNGANVAANIWPCISLGPYYAGSSESSLGDLNQIAPNDTNNQGAALYSKHGGQFNYLFHDGHVAGLTIEQTVGSGTTNLPLGLWTIASND